MDKYETGYAVYRDGIASLHSIYNTNDGRISVVFKNIEDAKKIADRINAFVARDSSAAEVLLQMRPATVSVKEHKILLWERDGGEKETMDLGIATSK